MSLQRYFKAALHAVTITALAVMVALPMKAAVAGTIRRETTLTGIPTLQKNKNGVVQLCVNGSPFLMLGGEVSNSSSSNLAYMEKIWTHMNQLHANTVLLPVSWQQMEPEEGKFDFSLVDGLIKGARAHHLHLVLLWLASWKNGMSCYDPLWVKKDYQRFPRAERKDGTPIQVLSTFSSNNWQADASAFAALMHHLREVDSADHTVLMVQVENEVGILGDSRDRSPIANAEFHGQAPKALMDYITKNAQSIVPELRSLWVQAGEKRSGTWQEVFGSSPKTDEIFMAWHYARYIDHVAAAGEEQYPIPLYCNAWLNDPMDSPPGNYPSGCPEAQVMDIWKAGAPHISLLAPDLYAGDFQTRCELYTRQGNTLFIPEMNSDAGGARNAFQAIGRFHSLGTSPFGIDNTPVDGPFSSSYDVLSQIAPILLQHQGNGESIGFSLDSDHPEVKYDMGNYEVDITLDSIFGHTASVGSGIIIATEPDQFLGAGSGFRVAFRPLTPGPKYAGIGIVNQGVFNNGVWVPGRQLNGDETDQGSGWRFSSFQMSVEKCTVYRYD